MYGLLAVLAAGSMSVPLPAQTPPIFQPGAPGAATRTITASEAVAINRSSFTAADVAFMQHMILHHAQAVEMVGLLEARGSKPQVKLLGRRIAMSQEAEMELMRGWLLQRDQPLAMAGMGGHAGMDHGGHAGHATDADDTPMMAGMLTPRQMRTLAQAEGPEFDRLFLTGMIQHHQGALDMVDTLMETPDAAEDTLLSDFTTSVVADQSAEILRMQSDTVRPLILRFERARHDRSQTAAYLRRRARRAAGRDRRLGPAGLGRRQCPGHRHRCAIQSVGRFRGCGAGGIRDGTDQPHCRHAPGFGTEDSCSRRPPAPRSVPPCEPGPRATRSFSLLGTGQQRHGHVERQAVHRQLQRLQRL